MGSRTYPFQGSFSLSDPSRLKPGHEAAKRTSLESRWLQISHRIPDVSKTRYRGCQSTWMMRIGWEPVFVELNGRGYSILRSGQKTIRRFGSEENKCVCGVEESQLFAARGFSQSLGVDLSSAEYKAAKVEAEAEPTLDERKLSDGLKNRSKQIKSACSGNEGEGQTTSGREYVLESSSFAVQENRQNWHSRVEEGVLVTVAHFVCSVCALILADYHFGHIIRQPYFLTLPFLVSAMVTAAVGCFFVPMLKVLKFQQFFRQEGPVSHFKKAGTPTMGGLFFVPVGIGTARYFAPSGSTEVWGSILVTFVFAAIGLMDDCLAISRKHNYGLPGWCKFSCQVAAGTAFFFWLKSANLHSTYTMNSLPPPFQLIHLGIWQLPLTAFCFAAMSNGVNLTDGLDGLAGGTAAAALISMAVAVLPFFPALGIFGSSMAGACFGFLVFNRHQAKVFMGDTGSLALGGALAAMGACSGMFFPLFIASGVFVIETVSVIGQVLHSKLTKRIFGERRRWLRMAPFHHHLESLGVRETLIVGAAYTLGCALAILAACLALRGYAVFG